MSLELVDFTSYLSKGGHTWVYAKYPEGRIPMKWKRSHSWTKFWKLPELKYPRESVGPFLTDGYIDIPKYWRLIEAGYTALRPFKTHPALFREFAETEFSGEAIRQFANKWGLLGATVATGTSTPSFVGKSHAWWKGTDRDFVGVVFRHWHFALSTPELASFRAAKVHASRFRARELSDRGLGCPL